MIAQGKAMRVLRALPSPWVRVSLGSRALKGRNYGGIACVALSGNAVKHFFQGIGAVLSSCVRQNADGERPKTRILANAATEMLHSVAFQGSRDGGFGTPRLVPHIICSASGDRKKVVQP